MANMSQSLESLSPVHRELFNQFGRGPRVEPTFSLVHQAFESIVDSQPSSVAVEHDGNTITYHELEKLSNMLANSLISKGLKPRQRVCLVLQRSINMVVAILAVLKCGCQYIPLDGGVVPDNVMAHIFKDTQAQYMLCLEKFHHRVQQFTTSTSTIVILDAAREKSTSSISGGRPVVSLNSSDGAYIIYTSGTAQDFFWK
jgi:non-ribosomal peptide synthetase component F